MKKKNDTDDTERGNTKEPVLRSRGWFFTFNNPHLKTQNSKDFAQKTIEFENCEEELIQIFEVAGVEKYIFQLEEGEICKTPHFQGMVYFQNARTFRSMKELHNQIHWEKMKDLRSSIKYCGKIDGRLKGPWAKGIKIPRQIKLINPNDRPWQKELVNELETEPNDRTIIWYHDPVGGSGKTALAKWLVIKKKALVVSGKACDIKYAVSKHIEKNGQVDIICFLFPRSVEEYVSYDAIESLKDGLFFSSKYESGMCVFAPPHIICFANFAPEKDKLSEDRWVIRTLSEPLPKKTVEQFLVDW